MQSPNNGNFKCLEKGYLRRLGGLTEMNKIFLIALMAIVSTTALALDLTGDWVCNLEGDFYITQVGDEVWMYGESMTGDPTWTSVAYGTIEENIIDMTWVDVPKGNGSIMGTLAFNVTSEDELQLINQTGGFGGDDWEQVKLLRINSGF